MAHSTADSDSRKPTKKKAKRPPPDFPLSERRGENRWCKKILGRVHYFAGTKQEALSEWLRVKDDLLAGRKPQPADGSLTLLELCDKFIKSKRSDLDSAALSPRTFAEYKRATDLLIHTFGRTRRVVDLRPDDFEQLYSKLAKKHTLVALGREVTMCRSVFKYAVDSDLLDRAVKFGPKFKVPSKADKRKAKAVTKREHGARVFTADQIRMLLDKAAPQLKAMILLAINAGLGNTDCALLPISAINFNSGWLDYPRPKTGIERRCPLWPETVAALRAVLDLRKKPRDERYAHLLFLTRLGQPWVRYELVESKDDAGKAVFKGKADDAIAKEMTKLLKELGIYRTKVTSFYTLRHTTETIGGGARDQVALDAIMGHCDASMSADYREGIDDARLVAVSDHVRAWLDLNEKKDIESKSSKPVLRIVG